MRSFEADVVMPFLSLQAHVEFLAGRVGVAGVLGSVPACLPAR